MQRIDQDESGLVSGGRPYSQIGQIRQIACTPGSLGLNTVELSGQPPCPPCAEPWWQLQRGGDDDQWRAGLERAGLHVQSVIAHRQIAGQLEGGLADQPVVEIIWGSVVLKLTQTGAHSAVLQTDPQADRIAVCDMHPEGRLGVCPSDDRRGQRATPVPAIVRGERGRPLLVGHGGHAERRQHSDQRRFRHVDVAAGPVRVFGSDAVAARQFGECW